MEKGMTYVGMWSWEYFWSEVEQCPIITRRFGFSLVLWNEQRLAVLESISLRDKDAAS